MGELEVIAEKWVRANVDGKRRQHQITAVVMFCAGVFCAGLTYAFIASFLVYAQLLMIASPIRIYPYLTSAVVVVLLLILYRLLRRRSEPEWQVYRVEGSADVAVVRPDQLSRRGWAFDEGGSRPMLSAFVSIVFMSAICFDEARREWGLSRRYARVPVTPLARVAALLATKTHYLPFDEIQEALPDADLVPVVLHAAWLPGFSIIASEPQGLRLTEDGYEALLVRPDEVADELVDASREQPEGANATGT